MINKKGLVWVLALALFLCIDIIPTAYYSSAFLDKQSEIVHEVSDSVNELNTDYPEVRKTDLLSTLRDAIDEEQISQGRYFGQNRSLYGRLTAPSAKLSIALYYPGEPVYTLSKGAMISGSVMPEDPGVTYIAGHNWPSFHKIGDLTVGSQFTITGPAGVLNYTVIGSKIGGTADSDIFVTGSSASINRVILYTCYPFDAMSTDLRYYVIGEKS